MTGHIDKADFESVWPSEFCITKVDRDPAFLLFAPAVWMIPAQRFNQSALAVVDVASGANNDGDGTGVCHGSGPG